MKKFKITAARARKLLHYDLKTGIVTSLTDRGHNARAGKRAGSRCSTNGYRHIRIENEIIPEHRLIWLYMTGKWPKHSIDHKNHIRDDNRWENLREATQSQQMANRSRNKKATNPYPGVFHIGHEHKRNKYWCAAFNYKGKTLKFGLYHTPEEAFEVYKKKAREIRGEFFNDDPEHLKRFGA